MRSFHALLRTAAAVSDVLTQERGSLEKIGRPSQGTDLRSWQTAGNCRWQAFPQILTDWAIGASDGAAMSRAPDGGGLCMIRL